MKCDLCECGTDDNITLTKRSPEGVAIWSKRLCHDCAMEIMDTPDNELDDLFE